MVTKKMKKAGFTKFDAADYLKDPEDVAGFISAAIEEAKGDQALIMHALNTAARAQKRNMSELAKQSGITRSGLYEALSGRRNPSFTTVLRLLEAMDLRVTVTTAR